MKLASKWDLSKPFNKASHLTHKAKPGMRGGNQGS